MSKAAPAAGNSAANTFEDKQILTEFIKYKTTNTLIWNGFKPDGTKRQSWDQTKSPNIDEHLDPKSKVKYGANLAFEEDGKLVARNSVVDVDGFKESGKTDEEFCQEVFSVDTKAIPFKSPSGENWHLWKFYPKNIPVEDAAADARSLGFKIKKLGYKVDFGKCNPTKTGSDVGINLPYAYDYQRPHDPRGKIINNFQLYNRIRFNNFPFIAAIINLTKGDNRHDAMLYAAAQLHHAGKYKLEYIEDIKNSFNHTNQIDENWFNRIIKKEKFKKYELKNTTIEDKIGEAIGVEKFKFNNDSSINTPDPIDSDEPVKELEVFEHTGQEQITTRPWIISGWLMEKCLTVLAGQPGVGKTVILHMIAWCLATGTGLFGKPIYRPGNVLLIAAEESLNEINIRLAAIQKFLGGELKDFKIYKRGLENDLKLVKFKAAHAEKTKQYKQLQLLIKSKNIKHIVLDPLINFQTGNYDENSNQHMEEYIKNTLIPLTFINNGSIVVGHHTNKISMVRIDEESKDIEVDPQSALTAARGASSLIGAARFVLTMQPMLKKIWSKFKEHVKDGSTFIHYAGIIEAKSNYNLVSDDIAWLKKNTVEIDAFDSLTQEVQKEKTGVFTLSTLHEITKSKLKLKAAEHELYVRGHMPLIKAMMDESKEDFDQVTLNSVVLKLLPLDPRISDPDVKEATIKTDIRRKLISGFGGGVKNDKGEVERTGLSYEDGYNYWYHVEANGKQQQWYIRRGKDFRR